LSSSHHSEGTLRQHGSLSGSLVLPEPAIPEERTQADAERSDRRRSRGDNIDLLEERRERDLVTDLKGPNESQGVNAIEKEMVKAMAAVSTADRPTRPRSGTGDARVQATQQKAAGKCDTQFINSATIATSVS
jgi:hypothetical protein